MWLSSLFSSRRVDRNDEAKFEPLLEDPEATARSPSPRDARPRRPITVAAMILAAWSIALICWNFVLLFPSLPALHETPQAPAILLSHCGNSTAEARALGCSYDTLEQSWVPPDCADLETLEEYQRWNTWPGFNDENGQQPLDAEAMSERTHASRYWIQPLDHGMHCVYTLKRHIKLGGRGKEMFSTDSSDGELPDLQASMEHHIHHCLSLLAHLAMGGSYAQEDDDIQKWSINRTGFSKCYGKRRSVTK
ncbi:hypothetical protein PG987_008072 [Apiospora arundinis]